MEECPVSVGDSKQAACAELMEVACADELGGVRILGAGMLVEAVGVLQVRGDTVADCDKYWAAEVGADNVNDTTQ